MDSIFLTHGMNAASFVSLVFGGGRVPSVELTVWFSKWDKAVLLG
jgi:hypothetical protein